MRAVRALEPVLFMRVWKRIIPTMPVWKKPLEQIESDSALSGLRWMKKPGDVLS